MRMPSRSASSISSGSAGISSGDSSATIVTSSTPARRAARATSRVVVIARRASSSELAARGTAAGALAPGGGGAQRGAGRVERDVAASHDDDALAEVDAEALVHVQEVLDGPQHAVELVSGQVEVPSPPGTDREEQRRVSCRGAR